MCVCVFAHVYEWRTLCWPEDTLTHPCLLTVLRSGRSTTESRAAPTAASNTPPPAPSSLLLPSCPGGSDVKAEHNEKKTRKQQERKQRPTFFPSFSLCTVCESEPSLYHHWGKQVKMFFKIWNMHVLKYLFNSWFIIAFLSCIPYCVLKDAIFALTYIPPPWRSSVHTCYYRDERWRWWCWSRHWKMPWEKFPSPEITLHSCVLWKPQLQKCSHRGLNAALWDNMETEMGWKYIQVESLHLRPCMEAPTVLF